jgi:hypothetical protein
VHLRVVPEPGLEQQRAELWSELRKLWAGLGVLMLKLESETDPLVLYESHKKGERMAVALGILHDDLAKLNERLEDE